ncbi:hypothetical protein CF081_20270, partial [Clostridium botulinum]
DFLANISHELKTPLNVIFTAVQILDLYKKDAESYDKKEQYIKDFEDNIIISVKDTGIGIPEDKIENIFDRFVQVDKTLRRNKE